MLFALNLLVFPGHSQSVRIISTKDGLPQSYISGLVQDDSSFVWIGTRSGLARYDGVQYKVFVHQVNDTGSIASNVINWIYRGHDNKLWLYFESGSIDRFDPVTETVLHYFSISPSDQSFVPLVRRGNIIDSQGDFWGIGRYSGLTRLDHLNRRMIHFTRESMDFPTDTLRGLLEDSRKNIWVLSQYTISLYDTVSRHFRHVALPFTQDFNTYFLFDEDLTDLYERENGEIMWGDRSHLYFYNPLNNRFRAFPLPDRSEIGIRWIREGPDGAPYFERKGIAYRYDDRAGLSVVGKTSLRDGDARSMLIDKSGLIWIGTNAAGIYQLDLVTPYFKAYTSKNEFPDSLLSYELGLSAASIFSWSADDQRFSAPGYHFRSAYDHAGRLWMGLKETVGYYDSRTRRLITLPKIPFEQEAAKHAIEIKGVGIDSTGVVYIIGVDGNLFRYDSGAKSWKSFIEDGLLRKAYGPNLMPQDIQIDDQDLWITSASDGLFFIDRKTRHIGQLTMPLLTSNQLLQMTADPDDPELLWIGSYGGLLRFNKKDRSWKIYTVKEGLPDNTVYALVNDLAGNLWFSTNKGICRFNRSTGAVRSFQVANGLPGDEFNRFHDLRLPDGRIAFGGTDGWALLDPRTIRDDNYDPPVAITNLRINNSDTDQLSGNYWLKNPANHISRLVLPFSENTLTLSFAGLEFNQPQDIHYRYELKGFEDKWVSSGNVSFVTYNKVPPGHYHFLVNASNASGRWSKYVKEMDITILPPWWRTWWAYLCYGILVVGFAWTFINFRVKRALLRQEIALKENESRQLKELDEMKSRFFSNITHEFRTPLTLILGPAEELQRLPGEVGRQRQLAGVITRNARQLLGLVNQLMELARLEAGFMTPPERIGSLQETISSVVDSFSGEAKEKGISLIMETPAPGKLHHFAPEILERIIYNLISNALKFTEWGGSVRVLLNETENGVSITVQDSGIGIPRERIAYIFQRFYQAHNDRPGAGGVGTGIGLSLVKELVDQQGGSIRVESHTEEEKKEAGWRGAIFTVELPYKSIEATPMQVSMTVQDSGEPGKGMRESNEDPRYQILIAEDNKELAAFIKESLETDYQVFHALNGERALQQALLLMPDLVISDVLMPLMDGFTFVRRLKTDLRTSHIPVIMLSALTSIDNRVEGLGYGANDYLTKPFLQAELLIKIRNLLDQQHRLREHIRRQLQEEAIPQNTAIAAPQEPFLARVYEIIAEHLDDPLFGVEALVEKLDMSRTSLHRKLKSVSGFSTGDLIRNYRLECSTIMLRKGNNSTDTAYKSGFGSPAYFTKCFRERYGMTPGEFIRLRQPHS